MNEVTTVLLENEMDLILANKQSMRLGELTGVPLSGQTTFATAVSEVARTAIDRSSDAVLTLYVSGKTEREKYIIAVVKDLPGKLSHKQQEGYAYAKRLVSNMGITNNTDETLIELRYRLANTIHLNDSLLEKIRVQLNADPEVSPYEEIKRKNKQLLELSDMLAKSEGRYKDLTNSLPIIICTVDVNGEMLYANKWLLEYTGQTIEQLNRDRWASVLHPEDFKAGWGEFHNSVRTKQARVSHRRFKDAATGEYRWHTGVATPVLDAHGEVTHYHSYMADVHAQKMMELALKDNKELKETQRLLEEKVKELNESNFQLKQFAYVASHDLQEPLRKIGFFADMIKARHQPLLDSEAGGMFDSIIRSTNRMKAMVHDILAYSTITDEKQRIELVDLNIVAQDVLLDLDLAVREKHAQISVGRLPSIEGNARQLKQLFENLLSNSLKYVDQGVVPVINISAAETENNITFYFKDNGIGFDINYLDKMFQLFQRLHNRDKYSGTGIGLALCKKIVQMHNGTITAVSKPGAGAEFIVTLPREHS